MSLGVSANRAKKKAKGIVLAKKAAPATTKKTSAKAKNSASAAVKSSAKKADSSKLVSEQIQLQMYDSMVKSRVLEERLIKIYKSGEAFFWIGGPGEEAFGVPLGMLADKGQGPQHDWLHLHYRCTPTLIAMGMPMIDSIRTIMNKSTDPSTGGRNFSNHYCFPKWNIAPVTSPIEVQYIIALGTARSQQRQKAKGVTIVTGGDAGTAEGDFASCLVWASRKGAELPMLITVQNNKWGISTSYDGQHGEAHIADRARGFGIKSQVIDGNDPIESYLAIKENLEYIRETGKPAFIEAHLSRLFGHSSASGANMTDSEVDCLKVFEQKLLKKGLLDPKEVKMTWEKYEEEGVRAQEQVRNEPAPTSESIWENIYVGSENADWRKY
jgi:2-oxoisovalerate dehydrogenase E1 component alpha subunit